MSRFIKLSFRAEDLFEMGLLLLCFLPVLYWASSLSFFPAPWPDDSTIYLAGMDWLNHLGLYRMHNQAPFLPSYDIANFNTMPGYTLIIGLAGKLGLNTVHLLRALGTAVYCLWLWLLNDWMKEQRWPLVTRVVILLAAVLSPVIRWGAMITRQEIWQAVLGFLMLQNIDHQALSRWRLPMLLAIAAFIHVEAIGWVPMVAVATVFSLAKVHSGWTLLRKWLLSMLDISLRTFFLISPWLLYVAKHYSIFREQMEIQFERILKLHLVLYGQGWFFGFWQGQFGSYPVLPVLQSAISALVWIWFSIAIFRAVWILLIRPAEDKKIMALLAGALVALLTFFTMYLVKSEVWFITLTYICLVLVTGVVLKSHIQNLSRYVLFGITGLYAVASATVTTAQWLTARDFFKWEDYQEWVNCLDRSVGDSKIVWQPGPLDSLIDLHRKHPDRDYFRANDFVDVVPENEAVFLPKVQTFLLTNIVTPGSVYRYEGMMREEDELVEPYLIQLKKEAGVPLKLRTCHIGYFWGTTAKPQKITQTHPMAR